MLRVSSSRIFWLKVEINFVINAQFVLDKLSIFFVTNIMANKRRTNKNYRSIYLHREDLYERSCVLGERNDCTVFAVAIAFDISYDLSRKFMADYGARSPRKGGFTYYALPYIGNKLCAGIRYGYPEVKQCGNRSVGISFGGFAKQNPKGIYILQSIGHVAACIDGIVYDNGNTTRNHLMSYFEITRTQDFEI